MSAQDVTKSKDFKQELRGFQLIFKRARSASAGREAERKARIERRKRKNMRMRVLNPYELERDYRFDKLSIRAQVEVKA